MARTPQARQGGQAAAARPAAAGQAALCPTTPTPVLAPLPQPPAQSRLHPWRAHRRRDRADKQRLHDQRLQAKLEQKARRRARDGGAAADGPVATLGGAGEGECVTYACAASWGWAGGHSCGRR